MIIAKINLVIDFIQKNLYFLKKIFFHKPEKTIFTLFSSNSLTNFQNLHLNTLP